MMNSLNAALTALLFPVALGVGLFPQVAAAQVSAEAATAPAAAAGDLEPMGEGFAARAVGPAAAEGGLLHGDVGVVTFEDLDDLLIWRDGKGPNGEAALRQLLELRVIRSLGQERGILITKEMLDQRFKELDAEAKASGVAGLEAYIASQGVTVGEFRDYLSLGMIHESLTRKALGLKDGAAVTGEQQNIWLAQELKERGYVQEEHPWKEGVVCTSGNVVITRKEFGEYLRTQVDDADEQEALYLILLERAVRARMPEVTPEGANKALDREIERRAAEAEANPDYQGVTYDRLLEARGLSIEAVRRDPAIRSAALAHESVDRNHDEASLRAFYEKERGFFDGRFGEAIAVRILFKNASNRDDDPLRPSFTKVEQELRDLKAAIPGPEDFLRVVELHSQDKVTRERGGLLGQVTRAGTSKELEELRNMAFGVVDADPEAAKDTIIGPIRLEHGVILAMLGSRTPAPTWADMMGHVHRDLRRRFLEETLMRDAVVTYLDVK